MVNLDGLTYASNLKLASVQGDDRHFGRATLATTPWWPTTADAWHRAVINAAAENHVG